MIFRKFNFSTRARQDNTVTPAGVARQAFSTLETPLNVPYLAAPTHVARLCYLVAPNYGMQNIF
jgi:hypothetical protein